MDQMRKDLDEVMSALRNMDAAISLLSKQVGWGELCFKLVQDSGVIHMADVIRQVMVDHKKMQVQIKVLSMRLDNLKDQDEDGESGGSHQKIMGKPSMNKFGN